MELSDTKWEEFEPYHMYFAGISDEAWRGEQNGSKIRGFSGDVLNMDVDELSRKLVERKQMEKKVDGGGDIIEVHQRLEKMLTRETVGDVDEHAHETETMKDNLPNLDEFGEDGGVEWIIHSLILNSITEE
eukprot:scaffold31177_cov80-Cyclotella_meneghiniana.AAC.2